MAEQLDVLRLVVERLERAAVRYMVSGSMAMTFHAAPRMTRDIDIVVELGRDDVAALPRLFQADFYLDEEAVAIAVSSGGMFNALHDDTLVKVDFIVRKDSEFRRLEFERRTTFMLGETAVCVVSAEDLILSKLVWAKEGGSQRQLEDVRNLLRAGGDSLDTGYLDRWSAELDVTRELRESAT